MHLGNGNITPMCAVYGASLASATIAIGASLARRGPAPAAAKYGLGAAFVLAMQSFNVPTGNGVTGHLIGGVLLAHWFGAGWGMLGMTAVLTVQSLLLADGGLTALGVNIVNMAVIPCLLVYPGVQRLVCRGILTRNQGLAAASWLSVVLAAGACAVALLSTTPGREHGSTLSVQLVGVHTVIGLLEAVLTVATVLLAERLIIERCLSSAAVLISALAFVLIAIVGQSPWPDGLEFTLSRLQLGAAVSNVDRFQQGIAAQIESVVPAAFFGCIAAGTAAIGLLVALTKKRARHA